MSRMQKALDDPPRRAWITGKLPGGPLTPSAEFLTQAETMRRTMGSPAFQEMARLMQSPAVVKHMEFMRNYMEKVKVAEHAFPPRQNFQKKWF